VGIDEKVQPCDATRVHEPASLTVFVRPSAL